MTSVGAKHPDGRAAIGSAALRPPAGATPPRRRPGPPIAELLDVDREYRERAARDTLPRIAPRRFNPAGEAWLPILHTHRGRRVYTALFSNTERAHHVGRTRDWVIVVCDDGSNARQYTVITAERGKLVGRRIVPGRERQCAAHYRREPRPGAPGAAGARPPSHG